MTATVSRHVNPVPGPAKSQDKIFYDLLRGDRRPTSWYDAKDITATDQQILSSRAIDGTFPSDARMGSTAGVDASDPVRPVWAGEHYVWFSPSTTNRLEGPVLSLTDDFDIRLNVQLDDWDTASEQVILGRAVQMHVGVLNNALRFTFRGVGSYLSTVPTGFVDGSRHWVRFTRVRSTGAVEFFTSADGVTWTQLGTTVTGSTAALGGGTPLLLGGTELASTFQGAIFFASVSGSVGGSPLATFDPATQIDTSADPDAGQTSFGGWTVNRSATGLKTEVVTGSIVVPDGDDDLVQLQAGDAPTFTATDGEYSVIFSGRWNVETEANRRIYSAETAANDGMSIITNSVSTEVPRLRVDGGTSVGLDFPGAALAVREAFVIGVSFSDGTATLMRHGEATTPTLDYSGVGTITHATPRLFRNAGTGITFPSGVPARACIVSHNTMTKAEFDAIATKLIAGAYA